MDLDDDDLCSQLLSDCGFTDETTDIIIYGICCGEDMMVMAGLMVCQICGSMQQVKDDSEHDFVKGPSTYHIGNRSYTCYNCEPKSRNDKIADLVNDYKNKIARCGRCIDGKLLNDTCTIMHDITRDHIKKKDNRTSLFASLLYYISINMGQILTQHEIKNILGENIKFSKGVKIISNSIICKIITPGRIGINTRIHNQLISKYLSIYDPEFYLEDGNPTNRNINTNDNRKFCNMMIDVILRHNIAYNSLIQSKCIAVIYYLIRIKYVYDNEKLQRQYFTSIVDIGGNTFMKVFMTLLGDLAQKMFRDSGKFG